MTGALVLLLAASRGWAESCNTCDRQFAGAPLQCLPAGFGIVGNSDCRIVMDSVVSLSGITMHAVCIYSGDTCFSAQYDSFLDTFRGTNIYGFSLDPGTGYFDGFGGLDGGCCTPDGTDWCRVWGMPAGCT